MTWSKRIAGTENRKLLAGVIESADDAEITLSDLSALCIQDVASIEIKDSALTYAD